MLSALQNPLILNRIFTSLAGPLSAEPDFNTLFSAAQVSKKWNYEANKIIWHEPPIPALLQIEKNERQKFADFTEELSFNGDDECHANVYQQLGSLKWPKLERLAFDASDENTSERIAKFIVPGLKRLEIYGGPIDDSFLKLVAETCSHLHSVTIDNPRQGVSITGITYLLNCRKDTLKEFVCLYGMDYITTPEMILTLSHICGLRSLGLGGLIRSHWIPQKSFPELRKIQLLIEAKVTGILSTIGSLENLALRIEGDCSEVFANLKSLNKLADVEVFSQNGTIRPNDLLTVCRNNPDIKSLVIIPENGTTSLPATEEDIIALINTLPKLDTLRLQVLSGNQVTQDIIATIALKCPKLKILALSNGNFDLCKIPETAPCFEHLEELELAELIEGDIEKNVKVMQTLFPFVDGPFAESEEEWITLLKKKLAVTVGDRDDVEVDTDDPDNPEE
ncbi:hypothetical protein NEOLI_001765 [Neolecta irregularis DAH-3]|uniref:F-box domain-containing protein n=1 Tax=Neolecta irregularis (strain DAH-3) TaxID=1198029 RepID=A0A1U7LIG4_NEOID|nr:hypothetical protein NEOLI_001765 [Neolecta irregularis DAH-3]|eukprot:OLL22418.1 hypothetical protein NEOLI_001765 [Neolecta irregularis DAH-3]